MLGIRRRRRVRRARAVRKAVRRARVGRMARRMAVRAGGRARRGRARARR